MKKTFRFFIKFLAWFFLGIISLLIISYLTASAYKKEILAYFNTEINNGISGTAHLDNINFTIFQQFPSVSVTLLGLTIQDSVYKTEVIKAERVYLQVQLLKLLKKELNVKSIILQNAHFNIFKDSLGYSNLSVFSGSKVKTDTNVRTSTRLMDLSLKKILFKNVSLNYLDDKKKKKIQLTCEDMLIGFKKPDGLVLCNLKGKVLSEGLLFNNLKGPFLADKELFLDLSLHYNPADSVLTLLPSNIKSDGQLYDVTGHSQLNRKFPLIYLNIQTSDTDYDKAISLLNTHLQKALSRYHVDNGLSSQVFLVLDTKPGVQPFAKVDFQIKNSRVRLVDYFLDNVTLNGSFQNHQDTTLLASDENSVLTISASDFSYKEINFKVDGFLQNLTHPKTNISALVSGPLTAFHHYLDTAFYKFSEGSFTLKVNQKGPISLTNIPDPIMFKGHIDALMNIQKGNLSIIKNHLSLSEINGDLKFVIQM